MTRVSFALGFVAFCAAGPWLAPYDPTSIDAGPSLAVPSSLHWLGTDVLGRDVWSRWLHGARLSLAIGLAVTTMATGFGAMVGAVAGYSGGAVDRAVRFVVDLMLSLPRIVVVLATVGLLRWSGSANIALMVLVLGATSWMGLARIVRAEVLSLVARDHVASAVALGLSPARVLLRHVMPHTLSSVGVFASLAVGQAILAEAALSYLGLGVLPPTPSWGAMVADGASQLRSAPWLALAPGCGITGTVLLFTLLADAVRDGSDPRSSGVRPVR